MLERGQFAFPAIFEPSDSEQDVVLFRLNAVRLFAPVSLPYSGRYFDGSASRGNKKLPGKFRLYTLRIPPVKSYLLNSTSFSYLKIARSCLSVKFEIFITDKEGFRLFYRS